MKKDSHLQLCHNVKASEEIFPYYDFLNSEPFIEYKMSLTKKTYLKSNGWFSVTLIWAFMSNSCPPSWLEKWKIEYKNGKASEN